MNSDDPEEFHGEIENIPILGLTLDPFWLFVTGLMGLMVGHWMR